jgi:hypothetical protein
MKHMFFAALAFMSLLLFSCKKDDKVDNGPTPDPVGIPTQVGVSIGEPISRKVFGPNGGHLGSYDGRLRIVIPAGALTQDQEVTIESITNFNPLAIGNAYRITPHNVQFQKPVTIQFVYDEEEIPNTIPDALSIAYQDENKIWKALGSATVDKLNKVVSVTTTHFSDWSLFESIYMLAQNNQLPVKKTTELEIYTTEDLLAPLSQGKEVAMGKKMSVATKYIKSWKLAGAGKLVPNGSYANYTAPATVPGNPNPVAVSVELELPQKGKFILVEHIEIIDDAGEIEVRVAGGTWVKKYASPAVKMNDNLIMIADSDGDTQGSYVLVMVEPGVGLHAFKDPNTPLGNHAHYLITNGNNYTCSYITNDQLVPSGGGINITSMGEQDGYITGTFTMNPAGYGEGLRNTILVEGKFKVKKGWQ